MNSCFGQIRRSLRPSSLTTFCPKDRLWQLPTTAARRGSMAASFSSEAVDAETTDRVSVDVDTSGICRVQLNRPKKLNAFDLEMFEAVAETAQELKEDRSIRTVILSGNGRAFSSGLDVKSVVKGGEPMKMIERLLQRESRPGVDYPTNLAQDVSMLWRELDVPVICVLQGMCFGAGLQIALGADFRYSTPDCQLSVMEGKWGLIPDMGASVLLRELVRIDVAKELTMTGRIVSGQEAADLGLVTRVCEDPIKEADLFAEELVQRSPDALAAAKQLFQSTWTDASDEESLLLETKLQRKLLVSWNQLAASGRSTTGLEFPYRKRK